jgi:hypothetical protein
VPDAKIGVRRVLRRDKMLVAQVVTSGTKKWSGHGTAETPKKIGYESVYFILADDAGRARETLLYFDQAVSMRQIGTLSGEKRTPLEPSREKPEIVDATEIDGAADIAIAALTALGDKGRDLAGLVAPEFTYIDTKTDRKISLGALPEFLAAERLMEKGLVYTAQQSLAARPFVAVRWEASGRFAGKGNVGPIDIVLHGAHIFKFADGKIVSVEAYDSDLEYLQKTGLIAEAVKGDDEEALGPRGPVPGQSATPQNAGKSN